MKKLIILLLIAFPAICFAQEVKPQKPARPTQTARVSPRDMSPEEKALFDSLRVQRRMIRELEEAKKTPAQKQAEVAAREKAEQNRLAVENAEKAKRMKEMRDEMKENDTKIKELKKK